MAFVIELCNYGTYVSSGFCDRALTLRDRCPSGFCDTCMCSFSAFPVLHGLGQVAYELLVRDINSPCSLYLLSSSKWSRVKLGKFGHQVNSDTHLQAV